MQCICIGREKKLLHLQKYVTYLYQITFFAENLKLFTHSFFFISEECSSTVYKCDMNMCSNNIIKMFENPYFLQQSIFPIPEVFSSLYHKQGQNIKLVVWFKV